jgi:hypothetical protein
MSRLAAANLRCVNCGRLIEVCACCGQDDCPPPICDRCLKDYILKTIRSRHVGSGASTSEGAEVPSSAFS